MCPWSSAWAGKGESPGVGVQAPRLQARLTFHLHLLLAEPRSLAPTCTRRLPAQNWPVFSPPRARSSLSF